MNGRVIRHQVLRGSTAERVAIILLAGELIFDTDLNIMFVGDGATYGGLPFSGEGPPLNIAVRTVDTVLTVEDYVIANSATPIQFTLQDATGYAKAVRINNTGNGELTVASVMAQPIYGPQGGPVTDIQLRKTNSIVLVPKSGAWYLW